MIPDILKSVAKLLAVSYVTPICLHFGTVVVYSFAADWIMSGPNQSNLWRCSLQLYLQLHQCLPLPRKRSPDGASPDLRLRTSNCSLLLIYLPQRDKRLSRPGWLTYSRWFTHISGHPSAAGRAQDRKSALVKDQRSTTVPRNQLYCHVNGLTGMNFTIGLCVCHSFYHLSRDV